MTSTYSWKGKRRAVKSLDERPPQPSTPSDAYIHAYEAQLSYGQLDIGREVASPAEDLPSSSRVRGRGLVKWHGDEERDIWAEKHHIIHLLTDLPPFSTPVPHSPAHSSSSWGSLPSDEETLFGISAPGQLEEYERNKKQLWIHALREERLREREKEDRSQRQADQFTVKHWEPDEQPPKEIYTLMQHTARSLAKSPNGQTLEMRILTNHLNDERFTFLRGRYMRAWTSVKDAAKRALRVENIAFQNQKGTVGSILGGYDSSGSDTASESDPNPPDPLYPPEPPPDEAPPPPPGGPIAAAIEADIHQPGDQSQAKDPPLVDEEEVRRQRRLRAAEWKRRRAEGAE